ncbi:MAG: hypothetical protein WC994_08610 [Brumimicrobium sp.]
MRKVNLLFVLFISCSLHVYCQDIADEGEIKHYRSYSSLFKNVIQVYLDSTYNRFGCANTDKLSILQRIGSDSTKKYYYYELRNMQNMPFHVDNYLEELKEMGKVVLMVDSIRVFIRESVLNDLPFKDSIEYIGKQHIILKYGNSFELCLPGASDYLRFVFLPNDQIEIERYECYMPLRTPHPSTTKPFQ